MSTSPQQQQPEDHEIVTECNHPDCGRVGRPWDFQAGYCSVAHRHQHEGRGALSDLKYSHTRCFTCFSTLKHVEPPKPDWAFQEVTSGWTFNPDEDRIEMLVSDQEVTRDSACGYQHLTPQATIDEKNSRTKIITGTICGECGSTDHTEHIAMVADGHRTAAFVVEHLDEESDEDFDTEELHRTYVETDDIEQAAGAAVMACRS